ncbi:MAG: hypothetical protein AB8B73_13290 [Ekhidna sp.]
MKNTLTAVLLLITTLSLAQVGDPFPSMEAETLKNEFVTIPADLSDKYTLIGLAYSKKSEQYLKGWFDPVYNQFIYKPKTPSVFDINFDVHCYFIPMFTGAKRPAYQKVMDKLKKTIDKRVQPNILFYKGQLKEYKEALNFKGNDTPYFFLLNPEGEIIYITSGRYTQTKMQEITDQVRDTMSN